MAEMKKQKATQQESPIVMPFIAVCGILVAACIAFGNPHLWLTNEEAGIVIPEAVINDDSNNKNPNQSSDPVSSEDEGEVISSYQAVSQSDDELRAVNVSLAAEAINDVVIAPGETFSFNDVVGDTENDERYQLAPVVYGSEMAYARGGGICQVSTALYIAALKADMEIVERHPHSLVVDYAAIGLDATLVYGVMDLKLKNNSDAPITIKTESHGQTVTISLLGTPRDDGVTINVYSKIINVGESENETTSAVYEVESYREYLDADDKVIETQYLATDTYEVYKDSTVKPTDGGFDATK